MAQPRSLSVTSDALTLVPTGRPEADDDHDLWAQALRKALTDLPAKDSRWLAEKQNRTPFTSTQIIHAIRPFQEKYSNHPVQKFFAKIDPIISHVRSFAGVISVFANANPIGAGITWGCIYLVLVVRTSIFRARKVQSCSSSQVAGNTQQSLERILDILSELSPQLTLFSRWHRLFPQKSFVEVSDAIKDTHSEIIGFCVTAVRHLRRKPIGKFCSAKSELTTTNVSSQYSPNNDTAGYRTDT